MYGRNAEEVKSALLAARPGLSVVLNPEKPRRNSFEITLLDGDKGKEGSKGNLIYLVSYIDFGAFRHPWCKSNFTKITNKKNAVLSSV